MKRKTAVKQRLNETPVFFNDTTLTSPDYFQISEFPLRLTAGKNLFKLRGNPNNLQIGSAINIEILDYNGNPIYSEIIDYIDEDQSRVVAIYIYKDTSPGDALVIITGEAKNVPSIWKNKPNVKWTRSITVNPTADNESEIIFTTDPEINIAEQTTVQLDRLYATTQFPVYNTGTITYNSLNGTPIITINGGKFNNDMVGGTLQVTNPINPTPTPIYNISSNTYTTTIKKILSETSALLNSEFIVYSSQSLNTHIYSGFEPSSYQISYESTPQYIPTQNSESSAIIEISGLEPATGDVSRIKVYTSGVGTVGTWELANDVELEETEIFISGTGSIEPYTSIGIFSSQSIIDTYWTADTFLGKTIQTPPTLTWSTASISNAVNISSTTNISAKNAVHVFAVSESFVGKFIKGSQYKVTFDAYATRDIYSNNEPPLLYVYMSGSAFNYDVSDYYNQELPINLGKQIGRININANSSRIDDYVINFNADETGDGIIKFVIVSGQWQLSDIRTTTDNDPGYTPNYTRFRTEIPTKHKSSNQLSFKIEYFNSSGVVSKLLSFKRNIPWQGGNRYIDGDFSMLTGSLYVADSLQSGVAISGYKDTGFIRSLGYDGFAAGNPGFLIWSGSALPGSAGTKGGVPYSGVGLELYADSNNYFRYSTQPSELDVRTETFFLGDPNSQYISGSNGQLEISSSGFLLNTNGSVTASAFLAVNPNGDVLFNSDSEFVDGVNIGRVVYFNTNESIYSGSFPNLFWNPISFETFILPGETTLTLSLTARFKNQSGGSRTFRIDNVYIQSASNTNTAPSGNFYDDWSTLQVINNGPINLIASVPAGATYGNSKTVQLATRTTAPVFSDFQGKFVRISLNFNRSSTGNVADEFRIRSVVVRTSRSVGGSIEPLPAGPIT